VLVGGIVCGAAIAIGISCMGIVVGVGSTAMAGIVSVLLLTLLLLVSVLELVLHCPYSPSCTNNHVHLLFVPWLHTFIFVPCLRTHPRPNRVISPNDDIFLLPIGYA